MCLKLFYHVFAGVFSLLEKWIKFCMDVRFLFFSFFLSFLYFNFKLFSKMNLSLSGKFFEHFFPCVKVRNRHKFVTHQLRLCSFPSFFCSLFSYNIKTLKHIKMHWSSVKWKRNCFNVSIYLYSLVDKKHLSTTMVFRHSVLKGLEERNAILVKGSPGVLVSGIQI